MWGQGRQEQTTVLVAAAAHPRSHGHMRPSFGHGLRGRLRCAHRADPQAGHPLGILAGEEEEGMELLGRGDLGEDEDVVLVGRIQERHALEGHVQVDA